ncbi:MAG TPA: sodium/glutamate symporter [Gemmatimonadaceae bacterium]|jgi:ESS family glutamate:Na+ symporter|nr:sodium/glutamate symporter [Gemmatimonadaceae bacterium]
MPTYELDLLQTLTLGAVVYFVGIELRKRIGWLDRLNIPAAVIGGLLFTVLHTLVRGRLFTVQLDTSAQQVLIVAFFTTIGMGASLALLRRGGIQVLVFLLFATAFCFAQNFLGMAIALGFGENPLLGVMAGSVTLVGGPATGLAFAPLFEEAGLVGAAPLALAAATVGIVCGGIVGGPVGTFLVRRFNLSSASQSTAEMRVELAPPPETLVVEVEREDNVVLRNLVVLAVAMGLGSILSRYFQSLGLTLPSYIGAMLVASVLRNLDDVTGRLQIDLKAMEFVGTVALNIFLVVALMDLKLWQLAGLAVPLFVILVAQVLLVVVFALTVSYWLMGRDYDSAVMSSGFVGFVLGTTANAMANMQALVRQFGPAPRAFLVVPLVGAFFIDFTNAVIITGFVNWFK